MSFKKYYVIEILVSPECEEPLSAYFENINTAGVSVENKTGSSDINFNIYFEYMPDEVKFSEEINSLFAQYEKLGIKTGKKEIKFGVFDEQDWQNSWKKNFTTFKIGDKLVIKPSWEQWNISEGEILLECDPGMAFGTGQHPTTRFCLAMLEKYAGKYSSVLDIGCGSGILCIAAAKLGAESAVGFDNDPVAIDHARQMSAQNQTDMLTSFFTHDLDRYKPDTKFDFVTANLFAEVLIQYRDKIESYVSDTGYLAITGITIWKKDIVCQEYLQCGFKVIDSFSDSEWCGFLLSH